MWPRSPRRVGHSSSSTLVYFTETPGRGTSDRERFRDLQETAIRKRKAGSLKKVLLSDRLAVVLTLRFLELVLGGLLTSPCEQETTSQAKLRGQPKGKLHADARSCSPLNFSAALVVLLQLLGPPGSGRRFEK